MPRRASPLRRSAAEWIVRGLLALAVAAAGYASVFRTLAYSVRGLDVERAHALDPDDGRITARLAQSLSVTGATPADRKRADMLARTALRQDPTAAAAAAALGLNAVARGNPAAARRLFAYAEMLSRRELVTQLWAIEDAVAREDIPAALRHYDVALRTSPEAQDILFPVLAAAISDPAIRAGLIGTLTARPLWGEQFITYAATSGSDPRATATLFLEMRKRGVEVYEGARTMAVNRLVSAGHMDDAWAYYAAVHERADRRLSRDPRFAASPAAPSLFDWIPINDGTIVTSIQSDVTGGAFEFAAPASVGGPLLQQMQILPPGRYRLEGHSMQIEQSEGVQPYWLLRCGNGRELGRVAMPNSAQANGVFTGEFTVPVGCPVQTLMLVARPTEAVSGLTGRIDRVRLAPIAGNANIES